MKRKYFLEGKNIGNFKIGKFENKKYECTCFCGNIRNISGYDLMLGRYKSCGCLTNFEHSFYEKNFKEKFWNQVKKGRNGCLEWIGINRGGYGRINYKGKTFTCSRLIWEWNFGKIPKNKLICHKCDNTFCINIDHLFLGTYQDNMQDCVQKGRKNGRVGEKNSQVKLNEEKVREIKLMLKQKISCAEIAKKFKVGTTTIGRIKYGHTWKHIQ